jgi:adenylate kinase
MKFVLLGPPASGKDTQAEKLKKRFEIPHLSLMNMLQDEVSRKTDYGKKIKPYLERGEFGSDDLITDFLLNHIDKNCPAGFILDGFPRTIAQAEKLHEKHTIVAAILLDVPEDEIIQRITTRRFCKKCNKTYHLKLNPPRAQSFCDHCGEKLSRKKDDSPKKVKKRLKAWHEDTKPIIDFYQKIGVLHRVDGRGAPEFIFNEILNIM